MNETTGDSSHDGTLGACRPEAATSDSVSWIPSAQVDPDHGTARLTGDFQTYAAGDMTVFLEPFSDGDGHSGHMGDPAADAHSLRLYRDDVLVGELHR